MIKKITLLLSVILLLSFTLSNNFRALVIEKLTDYANNYPEKIYVQTDKPYYVTGEDIWYTAYLVNAISHERSNKSRVIYVELIDPQDSIVSKKQLYTNDISVAGDFKIEKKWAAGNYILRGYTNYMRNKDVDYFFQKEIPIWKTPNDSLSVDINSITQNKPIEDTLTVFPEINFYPEGGYLVEGILTKIGIKVKDIHNRNITVKGIIKDSDHKELCAFQTYEFGLGLASIIPESNKTYYASIIINNQEAKYPLPKALPKGFNLNIVNNGDEIILKTSTNNAVGLKNSFLIVHQRGDIVFEKLETESKNSYTLRLKTNTLSNGIANFTLFDSSGNPVCERLVYINNPNDEVVLNISSNKETPKTRDKVTLKIDLTDKNGEALSGNLSMSITDLDVVEQNSRDENIRTYLLLNSDLRGEIPNPGYFFEKENDPKRKYILDLVMLTHGWRRFTWNEVLYGDATKKTNPYAPEIGLYISGETHELDKQGKRISAATKLNIAENILHQESKQSDYKGKFSYGPYVFYDSISVIIQARLKDFERDFTDNRNIKIILDEKRDFRPRVIRDNIIKSNNPEYSSIANYINNATKISEIDSEFLKNATRLDEVLIVAKKKSEIQERTALLNDRADNVFPTHRLDLKDFIGGESQSIILLLNTLPGVTANSQGVSIRNGGPAGIRLDGFPVLFDDISFMFGSEIEFIDVLSGVNAGFYSNASNGIISIYTKTGNFNSENIKRKPGIINFKSIGFYTAREFYAPNHSNSFDELKKQDIRTTLHWEPKIVLTTDSTEAKVSFFTSDSKSKYAIKIEGITNNGKPFYHFSTFEVN